MNLLSAVEQVVELSKGSRLNDEFYKKAARPLKHLADNLELSKEQCMMMALFIDNSIIQILESATSLVTLIVALPAPSVSWQMSMIWYAVGWSVAIIPNVR